jgi:hypothetical protein
MKLQLQPTPLDELVQDYHSTISVLLIHLLPFQPLHVSDESREGEVSGNATPNSGLSRSRSQQEPLEGRKDICNFSS